MSTRSSLASLPALPLEDGDRILVPATPGFVSAFGSVNNENVFIYKQGKTVAEVLAAKPTAAYDAKIPGALGIAPGGGGTTADRFVRMLYSELKK